MPAKKVTKTIRRKTVTKKQEHALEEFSAAMMVGIISLLLAMASLASFRLFMGMTAISLGLISIWLAVKNNEYKYLFLGVAGTLIALVSIWNYGIFTELSSSFIFGY